jgi:mono/diheme cytochrome c family protein
LTHRLLPLVLGCALTGAGWLRAAADPPKPPDAPPAKATFDDVAPLFAKHCTSCHGDKKARGGINLEKFKDQESVLKNLKVWERVADAIRAGDMPPSTKPRPTEAVIDKLVAWLDGEVFKTDCTSKRDPGRVTIRRLNRAEYDNTIRDLIGVSVHASDEFPSDDVGYGFDNIGDVLSMPPILMEKYLTAAEKVVDAVWKSDDARKRLLVAERKDKAEWADAAGKVLRPFADRAFRRPATDEEIKRLVRFVEAAGKNGDSFEVGIQLAVQATLVSPHFLFRVEVDKEPNNPDAIHAITDWELASRLSFFLWSSMPDSQLFDLARKGELHKPEVLEAQARRMLKDAKAHALVENFADQWLTLRNLKSIAPDPALFPKFDETLRTAMLKETESYFDYVVKEDRSVLDLIDSDYTFVNEHLAKHYGLPGVKGEAFQKVTLKGGRRGGLLTQASILTVTSNPTRTSPVKRGKWILENILNAPPPPPPPDVPALKEEPVSATASLRERMEQHRSNPSCAVCHTKMDALGFAFENFDAVGAWREKDGKFAIDPSGELPDGKKFKGPSELQTILKGNTDVFARCLSEKLLTYALGRGLERSDRCAVDDLVHNAAKSEYTFSSLVVEIVKSDPFLKRRGKRGVK